MPLTGNVARTLGQVLLAVGAIAVVLGLLGLAFGAVLVRDAAANQSEAYQELGDVLEVLVLGGLTLVGAGTLALVVGIVLIGVGRALRDRLERQRLAASPGSGAGPATSSGPGASTGDAGA